MANCRLVWVTDPHLNFVHQKGIEAFCRAIARKEPDALVITGDISEAPQLVTHLGFMQIQLDSLHPTPIFFVCGNHDYYHGSIYEMRENLRNLFTYDEEYKKNLVPRIAWLGSSGVVPLTDTTALIGHDGWYDGQYANWFQSKIELWDYTIIAELGPGCPTRNDRFAKINELSQAGADYVKENLEVAFKDYQHVFVATHVSPFRENSVYNGQVSDDNWMPHFSSKRMGDVLLEAAKNNPDKNITVLCGHSHGEADNMILPNLRCLTGKARYRHPKINKVFDL